MAPPRDYIVRAMPSGYELRETEDGGNTLVGHFSVFNQWTEINSAYEGRFMERIAPGAFKKTMTERSPKVLFNHGQDPTMGDQVLGNPDVLEEDDFGARYEVSLFDGIPPLIRSGLAKGAYGSSFRFRVTRGADAVSAKRDANGDYPDYNPAGLPERTIREVELYEFGPVTFPAYAGATAGIRSMTDEYLRSILADQSAPSVDAEAAPHLEPERREDPDPPPIEAATTEDQDLPKGRSLDSQEPTIVDTKYEAREDKVARVAELKEVLARQAEQFSGVMPDDEQAAWDRDNAELDALSADIVALDARTARVVSFGGDDEKAKPGFDLPRMKTIRQNVTRSLSDVYAPVTNVRTKEEWDQTVRDDAMRALEVARFPHPATDEDKTRDQIAELLDFGDSPSKELALRLKYTGSPLYRRAFDKIVKGRGTSMLTPEEQRGTALAVGVDGTGGFAVPFAFDPTVIAIGSWSGAVNPYRAQCRVVQIVGTDTWNALTATAVVATRTTEAAAATEQGPTFAQPQYVVKRVQGQITTSYEMLQDRSDLASELAVLINEAKDNEEEASWATGAGSGSASIGVGPVTGTSGAFTSVSTAGASLAAADADLAEAALPVRHRFNAQWFLSRSAIRRFQALETTGGKLFGGSQYPAVGNPIVSGVGNTGLRLLGYPINESPSLPTSTATTITIGSLINVSQYVIVDRVGLSIQFIPWLFNSSALATGQAAIYFMYRNHAAPINVDGGRILRYV